MIRPAAIAVLMDAFDDLVLREASFLDGSVHGALFGPTSPGCDVETSLYRYVLWRMWKDGGRCLVVLMLNPSTATHLDDDNTVNRVTTRAHRMGYDGLVVVNIFAWRDTLPRDMRQATDPVGPANDMAIDLVVDGADMVLCGWGANGTHFDRASTVAARLEARGIPLRSLGTTRTGHPEHPLYLSFSREPQPWSPSSLVG